MKYKKILIFLITMTMLSSVIVGAVGINIKSANLNGNDADLPVWSIGDSWTYEVTIDGGLPEFGADNVQLSDFAFTVEQIQAEQYLLDFSSDISGRMDLSTSIFVTFIDTSIQGTAYVNKSTIALEQIQDLEIDGNIKINNLPGSIPFDATGHINITTFGADLPVKFPLNVDDNWFVDYSSLEISINHGISIPGIDIPDPFELNLYAQDHYASCIGWDIVNNAEYDALQIETVTDLGENGEWTHNVWYSPAVGNVVKVESRNMPLSWGGWGYYDIDIELKSTTYQASSNAPQTPDAPSGPTSVDVGNSAEYTTVTTDPDDDKVRYVFDWGDGESSVSDFEVSGEQITVSHTFMQKGTYEVKVKARDKYGATSSWSDPITVTVVNTAPTKPDTPDGPASGRIKTDHTYSTSATDSEGHRIRYHFDWGDGSSSWTDYIDSGEVVSETHQWRRSSSYEIKVQAVDEYGEESEWSDPLPISMPRTRNLISSRIIEILEMLLEKYPLVQQLITFF